MSFPNLPKVNTRYVRSQSEAKQDFLDCCRYINKGMTWVEIHEAVMLQREYHVSVQALQANYGKMLELAAVEMNSEDQLKRAIEDLDAVMTKCIIGYNASVEEYHQIAISGTMIGEMDTPTAMDESGTLYEVKKAVTNVKSHGDTKYLQMYMRAFEKKSKLLGWDKPKEFNINHFLKATKIDDGTMGTSQPIRSEEEAKAYGHGLLRDELLD